MLNSTVKATLASRTQIAEGFGSFIFALTRPRVPASLDMRNVVAVLPNRRQGDALLEFFLDEILWIYHIIHVPTVRKHFDNLYTAIEDRQEPEYGPLALISTLYALTAYFSSQSSDLFFNYTESMPYCYKWTLLYVTSLFSPSCASGNADDDLPHISAQDALSAANCLACPTIETLQSLIYIAQHLMPNIGEAGFSYR